jgi:hypothetical protein
MLLGLRHVELDALFWGPDWSRCDDDEFRTRVEAAIRTDEWIVDGNYSRVRDLVWSRAETIVWLDYRFARVFWQLLRRTVRRCLHREPLWHGNRERLLTTLMSRDSILLWAIRTHRRRKKQYERLVVQPENEHLRVVCLRGPAATKQWLLTLERRSSSSPI